MDVRILIVVGELVVLVPFWIIAIVRGIAELKAGRHIESMTWAQRVIAVNLVVVLANTLLVSLILN